MKTKAGETPQEMKKFEITCRGSMWKGTGCEVCSKCKAEVSGMGETLRKAKEESKDLAYSAERFMKSVMEFDRVSQIHAPLDQIQSAQEKANDCWNKLENALHEFKRS